MFLRQKLDDRRLIKQKIKELRTSVLNNTSDRDGIVKKLLSLLDELQTHNLIIDKANRETNIELGKNGSKISLATAVEIRETLREKIAIITSLINLDKTNLDVLALMKQRDAMVQEAKSIDTAIRLTDWNVVLD